MKHLKVSCRALEDFTLGSWFQFQARKGAEKNDPLPRTLALQEICSTTKSSVTNEGILLGFI
jgi:hypothetical protein